MTESANLVVRLARKVRDDTAVRASAWSFGGLASSQFLRLAGNLVMTRLLVPEAFGIIALVNILLQGLVLLSDVGIQANIIRSSRGESTPFINTAWTIQVLRGLVIYVGLCLLAFPFARFYENDLLLMIVPVVGISAIFDGFRSTGIWVASRKMWVGRETVLNLLSQVAGIAVMIGWAWYSPTVWAIVAGTLVDALFRGVGSHFLYSEWRNRFRLERAAVAEILDFGKWIFLSSALMFFASQLDRLVLGKLVPLEVLGVYSIGFMWSQLPAMVAMRWIAKVFFPLVSVAHREVSDDGNRIASIRRKLNIIFGTGIVLFFALSDTLFSLLYEPEYQGASAITRVALIGVWFRILNLSNEKLNMVHGFASYVSLASFAAIVFFGASVYPLYAAWGAAGVAGAYAVGQFGAFLASALGTWRAGRSDFATDLTFTAALLAAGWALFVSVSALGSWLGAV